MPGRRESEPLTREQGRLLAQLREAFAAFRQSHPGRRRMPKELRAQVVAALDAGVGPTEVSRACGVSRTQVSRWRAERHKLGDGRAAGGGRRRAGTEDAQVLTVVDGAEATDDREAVAFEVAIGSWRLSVRLQPESGAR